ncbi:MAG: hypothetical protein GXO65_05245 [Euryarchaeota archaeon]|nr:hypothetical protein [Euryarchaeota archaeon]
MKLVVDAEVVFAALIGGGFTLRLIKRLSDEGHELLSPDYLLEEVERRKPKIKKFSGLDNPRIDFLLDLITERIKIVEKSEYQSFIKRANPIAAHAIDIPYFALAMATRSAIWSNEKGFKKQDKVRIYTTPELKRLVKL